MLITTDVKLEAASSQPHMRERQCERCLSAFTYAVARGTDRRFCGTVCRDAACAAKRHARRRNSSEPCSNPGCSKRVVFRVTERLCEACYCYQRRTGARRDPAKPYKLRGGSVSDSLRGYRAQRVPGHPLADKNGDLYQHRRVAYDFRQGVCGPCFWCATALSWSSAVVDHLNENKSDNDPSNLVLACNTCNRMRGAMLPFFRRLQPERFGELMELMRAQAQPVESVA